MFQGENLQKIRTLYGLSRKELGEQLQLSEQAIWQFENQITNPKFEVMVKLKELFDVKTQFFLQDSKYEAVFQEESVAYRLADIYSRKKTYTEVTYLQFIYEVITQLESYVNVSMGEIHELRNKTLQLYYQEASPEKRIQAIATLARKVLAIAPDNGDLLLKLEKSGIYVVEKDIGDKADAYSAWSANNVAFIVLGIKKSAVRRQFDLAHELGHLLMHHNIDILSLDKTTYNQLESEANQFAANFLLPEEMILPEFQKLKKVSNPDAYIELKAKYNVSIQALEMRAYKLGFLNPQQNSYFYRQITYKGYKTEEPLDSDMPLKRPGKIRSLFHVILSSQLTTLPDMEDVLKIKTTLLEKLFSIESTFFERYQANETFSNYGEILRPKFNVK
ncbi:spr1629 family repressor/antitoxin [Listeria booriae]|uniref:spr1629 family repressor/antitoxin n=1 Tax=Listeria booriae TaxID=1552123 RepID=UPI001627FBE6|nr:XRE family transcriptional regulator [Listeria booriae]MBC1512696.1 ImmA/IrrE family metallo-endopeptidase [Listeria booriae]MBC6151448.1 ImmA/IrrE family metallo-endopeptidase [Listeria booriae]MBC6305739.1 ImmA/IrrE family metallo-endopeptidase [Listeria booriae]